MPDITRQVEKLKDAGITDVEQMPVVVIESLSSLSEEELRTLANAQRQTGNINKGSPGTLGFGTIIF